MYMCVCVACVHILYIRNTVFYTQGIRYQMMEVFDGVVNLYQTCYSGGQYPHTHVVIELL